MKKWFSLYSDLIIYTNNLNGSSRNSASACTLRGLGPVAVAVIPEIVAFTQSGQPTGFTVDEPVDALGEKLVLPEWFEPNRSAIEQGLAPITLKIVEKAE